MKQIIACVIRGEPASRGFLTTPNGLSITLSWISERMPCAEPITAGASTRRRWPCIGKSWVSTPVILPERFVLANWYRWPHERPHLYRVDRRHLESHQGLLTRLPWLRPLLRRRCR